MAKVLVVGGAGYVGSAACAWLIDHKHQVHVLDDLSKGHRELALGTLTVARVGDRAALERVLRAERFDCVMHFAAHSEVGESVKYPERFHENNVTQTRVLLDTLAEAGPRRLIFSSTCSVFGDVGDQCVHEALPRQPTNPYGETKLAVEKMLEEDARARGLASIALRYFNAAGAEPQLRVGEWHEPESHLIPRLARAAARGEAIDVYGADYPTPDGTCVRDYVHVWDLAAAHAAAMDRLLAAGAGPARFEAFNLGSENGYSVLEVARAAERAMGRDITVNFKPRRAGDVPRLVADSALARRELGFQPRFTLDQMVRSAWEWELKRDEKSRLS